LTTPINIEVKAQVDDAVRGLGTATSSIGSLAHANQDASGALGVFGVSLTALNSPMTAVASGIKDSIDTTLRWGETIDKLSRSSGQSAEATSKMAVVLGDYGIATDSLDKVVKTFTKNGLEFNLDTIKKLAVEYQAIQDPVKRNEFAFHNFGRSAMEMNEVLSKSPAELAAVGDAALYSGKIMSEQGVKGMEDFRLKTAQLNDKLDGLKMAIGGPLIGVLSGAIDGFKAVTGTINALDIAVEAHLGLITWDQAALRAQAAAAGDVFAAFKQATPAVEANTAATQNQITVNAGALAVYNPVAVKLQEMATNTNTLSTADAKALGAKEALTLATQAQAAALTESNAKMAVADSMAGALTKQMIFQAAAVGLDAAGQAELAHKLGLMNDATFNSITQINAISKALADKKISVDQATTAEAGLTSQLGLTTPALANMPGVITEITGANEGVNVSLANFNSQMSNAHVTLVNATPALANMPGVIYPITTASDDAAKSVGRMKAAMDQLMSKTITLTVITEYVTHGHPGVDASAADLRAVQQNQSQYTGTP
jgi:hypothetical protein